jgi:hypothetical protein
MFQNIKKKKKKNVLLTSLLMVPYHHIDWYRIFIFIFKNYYIKKN